MANIVPASATRILERTLDNVRMKANSNGECFGGEIMDAMRDAGAALGVDRLEVLLTRTVLVRTMESLGEPYPAMVLQDYENRIPVSLALKYLHATIGWIAQVNNKDNAVTSESGYRADRATA